MRTPALWAALATALLAAACTDSPISPTAAPSAPSLSRGNLTLGARDLFRPARPVAGSGVGGLATDAGAAAALAASVPNIEYWGGPLIRTQRVAAIYFGSAPIYRGGPAPGTSGPGSGDRSLVGYYLNNLGGSPRWNVNTTYYEATNKPAIQLYVHPTMEYTSYWATPAAGAPRPGDLVDDAAMTGLIEAGFASGRLQYDPHTLYAVFTGPGVNLGGGFSPDGLAYCAYHYAYVRPTGQIAQYAAMPYDADYTPARPSTYGYVCTLQNGGANNDVGADNEVSALSHEIEETTTDPWLLPGNGGWYDINGYESSDKCAYQYGPTVAYNGAGYWNLTIGGKPFLVQQQWAVTTPQGCRTSYP
jgi:hypothetical protein